MPDTFEGDFDRWEHRIALLLAARKAAPGFYIGDVRRGPQSCLLLFALELSRRPAHDFAAGDPAHFRGSVRIKWEAPPVI